MSYAQSTVYGTVTDEGGAPVSGADVFVDGTNYYFYTESDGSFVIEVEPGTYDFVVSSFGFDEYKKTIEIGVDQTIEWLPILTTPDTATQKLDAIVIQADSNNEESEAATLNIQRKSVEIKEVKGAAELSRLGKTDAAQAVSAIAGVSKQESTNDVYVRGLGDRYLSTTLNGLSLPSNDVNKKNIDLNLFSSDIIKNVAVSKAYAAGINGDFAAGNIDISSKEQTGKDFLELSLASRVNSNSIGEDFVQSEGTGFFGYYGRYNDHPFATVLKQQMGPEDAVGPSPFSTNVGVNLGKTFRFEDNAKLSVFAAGSFSNAFDYMEGEQRNFTLTNVSDFPNVEKYKYSTVTTGLASVMMRFNPQNQLSYNTLLVNNSQDEVGYYGTKGLGKDRGADVESGFFQNNIQFNQELMWVNQLLGNHDLTDKINLDWGIGYNILKANEPDRKRVSITNYDKILDNDPNTSASFVSTKDFLTQRYFQDIYDDEINGRMRFKAKVKDNLTINFGGNSRYKQREFENHRYGYKFINTEINSLDEISDFFSAENWQINYNTVVVRGISIDNPETGDNVINLSNINLPGLPENTYNASLTNFATFVDFEWLINDKLLIVPGVRFEDFKQKINWDVSPGTLSAIDNPGEIESHESIFLPSLNLKYSFTKDKNLRLSASNTVSFPEFKEIAPFLYEGVTDRIRGNPDLIGRRAGRDYNNVEDVSYSKVLNLDLKYEWFFSKRELISLAVFYKSIQDPINLVVAGSATGDQIYFRTGEEATVMGIELDLRKDIIKQGDREFFVGLNASYMDTKQDLYDNISGTFTVPFNRDEEKLQGASDFIGNIDLNYTDRMGAFKPTFTLVGNYFSDRIYALGSGQVGNKMEKGIPTLDFLISTEVGKNAQIKLGTKNLLNPDIEIYRETAADDITLEKFKIGRIFSLGFNYKF